MRILVSDDEGTVVDHWVVGDDPDILLILGDAMQALANLTRTRAARAARARNDTCVPFDAAGAADLPF